MMLSALKRTTMVARLQAEIYLAEKSKPDAFLPYYDAIIL